MSRSIVEMSRQVIMGELMPVAEDCAIAGR
jgi:hypothetical protein